MDDDFAQSITGPPRLKDVAAAAGVSVATASRVLSGSPASAEAIAAVQEATLRLDYRPNATARALRARATGLVGVVVPSAENPFFSTLVEAIELALHGSRLDVVLAHSTSSPENEARRIETLIERNVDGLIIAPAHHHASAAALLRARRVIPLVQVDRRVDGLANDYVGVDNALGIELVLRHLEEVGCQTVAFASAAPTTSTGRSRADAFEMSLRRSGGLEATATLLGEYTVEFGREAARRLLEADERPDAIVCGSDIIALGAVRELRDNGLSVPGDIRVTGFDGILFAELCDPPLTTVLQPVQAIAEEAVRLLTSRIQGGASSPRRSQIAPTLVVRGSSVR
jgi:LacI family transcriptional regulator